MNGVRKGQIRVQNLIVACYSQMGDEEMYIFSPLQVTLSAWLFDIIIGHNKNKLASKGTIHWALCTRIILSPPRFRCLKKLGILSVHGTKINIVDHTYHCVEARRAPWWWWSLDNAWTTQSIIFSCVEHFFWIEIRKRVQKTKRESKGWGHISAHPYLLAYALCLSSPLDSFTLLKKEILTFLNQSFLTFKFHSMTCIFSCTVHLTE